MASLHLENGSTRGSGAEGSVVLEVDSNVVGPGQARRGGDDGGLVLTWEDLWVTVAGGGDGERAILQGVTGYARPGRLLAIMGPSGCGKSTLLDALAGRLSSSANQCGDILINGQKQKLAYGTSAYVTQDDTLISTLTVGEAVYYSAQLQLPDTMPSSEKKEVADRTIREMGLQGAVNTRVGGWGVKGLSGGQKRRVSICIEILTSPKLLFLDEPTSGLDSAASYYVMSRIASHQRRGPRTIVASIHQPCSEVFQLFDDLCLLSSGRLVYFGPAAAAMEFFSVNGFPCPPLQNPSDHFLRTINKDFDEDVEAGMNGRTTTEEAIDVLVQSYSSSDHYQQARNQVAKITKQGQVAVKESQSHASFLNQCVTLTRRSFVNMCRDLGYYWLRLLIFIVIALALGTIYFHLPGDFSSVEAKCSLLMFVASFLTFMSIGGFPSFVEEMKVFHRERLNGHYGNTAFVMGNTLSSLPFLLLISVIPGFLVYALTGLRRSSDHLAYFVTVLFTCMMLVESLMMIVASVVPNYLMGIIAGAGIQGLLILCGGFFRLPNDLPSPVWKYPLYYLAFHKYAYQGLFKNEFLGRRFDGGAAMDGEEVIREKWEVETWYGKWVDVAILVGMVAAYRVVFLGIVKGSEKMRHARRKYGGVKAKVFVDSSSTPPKT